MKMGDSFPVLKFCASCFLMVIFAWNNDLITRNREYLLACCCLWTDWPEMDVVNHFA